MKKTKKVLAKKILVGILEHTLDCVETFADAFKYPHICQNNYQDDCYKFIGETKRVQDRKYLKEELRRLKNQKFIEERKRGNRLILCLTDKGKKAALRHQITECNKLLKNKYYVVVFDIPESERNVRFFFRRFLKEADFVQLQKSVWVTQKEIFKPLKELIQAAEAEKWIHIITAADISNFSFNNKTK